MDFKNIPNCYRPIPFWSWNERLEPKETAEQVKMMCEAGIGGFFMHARGGLQNEYMGEEWFENITAAKDKAKELSMGAWAYDENGWPSGFGDGKVNGLGVEYQQKYLRMSDTEPAENVICKSGEHWFYYDVNPFYVDTLDEKVIAEFIKVAYEPYYERYKNEIEGFFTDEPQISRNGIPWSFVFEGEFKTRYNKDIKDILEQLYLPIGDYKQVRVEFWKMVTDLFSSAFMKQIYDWCNERSLKLTGHLVLEDKLAYQLITNGACMPHYEYFHIPGMDWLGRNIIRCLTPYQVSAVAQQLGKEQVLSETFALCGHNVSFAELKGIYEWQMVHGINLLCQHLEGYSIRGIRKRDYPPAMYCQQPWWSEYRAFNDSMSRVGMLLTQGEKQADVLLIHPMTTAWSIFDNTEESLYELDEKLADVIEALDRKHIKFHLGDETIMERHARVEGGRLIIGKQSYSVVLNPLGEMLLPNTERLLTEFKESGGKILAMEQLDDNNIVNNPEITYTSCSYPDFTVHYFVNTSPDRKCAGFNVCGKVLDIYTGELSEFCGNHEFEPWGSLVLIEDGGVDEKKELQPLDIIRPEGEYEVVGAVENALTLDRCDYYFDGVLQEKNGYVLNIAERANGLGKKVQIHQDYHVTIDEIPEKLYLVCETPEKFDIKVNGATIDKTVLGYYRDKSFKKIDISSYVAVGENTISFDIDFQQQAVFYENLEKAKAFESEKNKLVYDIEIEAIYLLGNFATVTEGEWTQLDKKAVRYSGEFRIGTPKKMVSIKNLEKQGFAFFAGELTLAGEIDITGENPTLELDMRGVNAVRVEINGITRVMLTDNRLQLAQFGAKGRTGVKLTLINNLRNLLGPHHLKEGESYIVGPNKFFKELCIWQTAEDEWDEDYCFVEFGI